MNKKIQIKKKKETKNVKRLPDVMMNLPCCVSVYCPLSVFVAQER